jgi:cytochrome d ubiquinol oxidase subunit II
MPAVGICAYLAAVYLCADATRAGQPDLAGAFRRRALGTGLIVGAVAVAGIAVWTPTRLCCSPDSPAGPCPWSPGPPRPG